MKGSSLTNSPSPLPQPARVTILYDAFGPQSALKKDWGFAALVEYGGKRIVFDAGNNGAFLATVVAVPVIHVSLRVCDFRRVQAWLERHPGRRTTSSVGVQWELRGAVARRDQGHARQLLRDPGP
jgi:hypothetical protein